MKNGSRIIMSENRATFMAIVSEHLQVEKSRITDEASFIDDLGADSLDTVELVMAAEEHFGIIIEDDEIENVETFGQAMKIIDDKTA